MGPYILFEVYLYHCEFKAYWLSFWFIHMPFTNYLLIFFMTKQYITQHLILQICFAFETELYSWFLHPSSFEQPPQLPLCCISCSVSTLSSTVFTLYDLIGNRMAMEIPVGHVCFLIVVYAKSSDCFSLPCIYAWTHCLILPF